MEDENKLYDGELSFRPLTLETWQDFEQLFGKTGACGGCWCMWWRLRRKEFDKQKGEGNKSAMYRIVEKGIVPGIIAYINKLPVGWCSVAPRDEFSVLDRSRILKRVDDQPVWSIVCFFVAKQYRCRGITIQLIKAAIEYAKKNGALIVEGYPVQPKKSKMPDVFAFTGFMSAFEKAGFTEIVRRSDTRPIMRYLIKN
ncbi:acetyltransferase (GNAT) family protein [Oxobacter pfennigii]|uniref:Acetyltransferase (GNAT) family protein n=1 Tax=Oxobacter pfennigii TaxID=36849 RepID=A0A0P9AL94_9CLOT|nr:GNAT family N-acetyltransferase [Oxobacter pfennigii]KPU46140.1 acetyltransferase (GNAT) family protein [Oxobacter pfennigii]